MKKIITLFFTLFLLICLTGCSIFDFNKKTTENTQITIGYVINDKKYYDTFNSYKDIEFRDYTTETGYEFKGWSKEKNGNVVIKEDLKGESSVTLYPIIKAIEYKIIYDLDGGVNNIDNPSTYTIEDEVNIKAPTKEDYAFTGWNVNSDTTLVQNYKIEKGSTGDILFKANYVIGKVNVIFDYEGIEMQTIDYNTKCSKPTDPVKAGDTFICWCIDDSLETEFDFDTLIKESITLYPKWQNTKYYKLSINSSEYVKSNRENGSMLPENALIDLYIDYIVENKAFVGWEIDGEYITNLNDVSLRMPSKNLTITPTFKSLTTYTYTKGNCKNLEIPISEEVTSLYGSDVGNNYDFDDNKLLISYSYLDKLFLGLHSYVLNGNTILYVFVKANNKKVTNIKIDYDINYPKATLIFDQDEMYNYSYSLDGSEYKSCNSYDTLTITDKFSAHTIDIKCDGYITNEVIEAISVTASEYLNKTFTYQGEIYDYYVDGFDDLKTIIEYEALAAYPSAKGNSHSIKFYYVDADKTIAADNYSNIVKSILSIPYGVSYQTSSTGKIVNFSLYSSGKFNSEATTQERSDLTTTNFKESNRTSTFNDFYIEKCTKTQEVRSIYELENLNMGIKPDIVDSKAQVLYDKAKEILRNYVDDTFTVYEKLKAIYDYLGTYVTYDDALLSISVNQSDYQSFTAYSAIVNGIAVCDGIASAFKLLCTIEGIECIEVVGLSKDSYNNFTGHAWNKVKIGNTWYGVDATWSKSGFEGKGIYVNHNYFLIDELSLMDGTSPHYEQATIGSYGMEGFNIDNTANNVLSYYDLITYANLDLVCTSLLEFQEMVAIFEANDINYVEIKLDGINSSSVFVYDSYYSLYKPTSSKVVLIH